MLLWLIHYLQSLGFHLPTVFLYTSTRAIMAALFTFIIGFFLTPPMIRLLNHFQCKDLVRVTEEVPALAGCHRKKSQIPTMGGVLMVLSMAAAFFLFMDWNLCYSWLFIFTAVSTGCAGCIDDLSKWKRKSAGKGMSEQTKYFVFGAITLALFSYLLFPAIQSFFPFEAPQAHLFLQKMGGELTFSMSDFQKSYFIPCFKYPIVFSGAMGTLIALITILFVMIGSAQSSNLTDGLDGLCAGSVLPPAAVLGSAAFLSGHLFLAKGLNLPYIEGAGEITIAMAAVFGSAIAFLWYNSYPAQWIMGDTGSLALGSLIGLAAILIRREWLLGIAAIVFVVEALSVIIQRISYKYFNKKRVFLCAPLHHHFQIKGIHESKIVVRFWIIAWLFGTLALATLKFQ